MTTYHEIYRHYEDCYARHGDNHLGMDWPNQGEALRRYAVMYEITKYSPINLDEPSILDFGCGLGHFYEFLQEIKAPIIYAGSDISNTFIHQCMRKFPHIKFFLGDILKDENFIPEFDYACLNGVFTEKRSLDFEEMWDFSTRVISAVWKNVKIGMAFNFMSKNVAWERDDLFHVSLDSITKFLSDNISRKYIVRSDYGLYENTLYVYR